MKHLAAAAFVLSTFSATSGFAGNLAPPIIDKDVIVQQTSKASSSSAMAITIATAIIMLAVTASGP